MESLLGIDIHDTLRGAWDEILRERLQGARTCWRSGTVGDVKSRTPIFGDRDGELARKAMVWMDRRAVAQR